MISYILRLSIILSLGWLLAACGPSAPSEATIRAKIIGTYCADDYKLILTDSSYTSVKYKTGILSKAITREDCKGTYQLALENGQWLIRYDKADNPRTIYNCKQEYTLWTQEEGYLIGEEKVLMKELIDNQELSKEACDE